MTAHIPDGNLIQCINPGCKARLVIMTLKDRSARPLNYMNCCPICGSQQSRARVKSAPRPEQPADDTPINLGG